MQPAERSIESVTDGDLARRIASMPAGTAVVEESELYKRFAPRVRLYGRRHLREEAAAQDLAQDVLSMTIERLRAGQVRNPDQIGSFILSSSRVMAASLQRTARRRQRLMEAFRPLPGGAEPRDAELDVEPVERCLGTLPDRDRALLVLTFYAERSAAEIASELGATAGAVRVARLRAIDRLRDCLGLRRRS